MQTPDVVNSVLFILIMVVMIYVVFKFNDYTETKELMTITSPIDGKEYHVRNKPDGKDACILLSTVRKNLITLVDNLKKRYPNDPRVKNLSDRFNADMEIRENIPKGKVTSYTLNKGEKMVFCLRQRDRNDTLLDLNTIMFVALHEISHIATESVDTDNHSQEFWDNMEFIVKEAIKDGLYTYQDYSKHPQDYCGTQISDTPIKNV